MVPESLKAFSFKYIVVNPIKWPELWFGMLLFSLRNYFLSLHLQALLQKMVIPSRKGLPEHPHQVLRSCFFSVPNTFR